MSEFNFIYNKFAYQWSLPELVASKLDAFSKNGIDFKMSVFAPVAGAKKNTLYIDMVKGRKTDLYHAGEWVCVERVLKDKDQSIIAASYPSSGTLNSSFTIYSKRNIASAGQVKIKVGVENETGSYFTVYQNFIEANSLQNVELVNIGSVHSRFEALLKDFVDCAVLIHPWDVLADHMGLHRVSVIQRRNPTLAVCRRIMDKVVLKSFFKSVNEAISMINQGNRTALELYIDKFLSICGEMDEPVKSTAKRVADKITLPKWKNWEPYRETDFKKALEILKSMDNTIEQATFNELVHPDMIQVFS